MKKILIDFAPHFFRRSMMQTSPLTWLSGGAGLLLSIAAAITAFNLVQQNTALATDLERINIQLGRYTIHPYPSRRATIQEQQEFAVNGAIAQLNLPWRDLLAAIETATTDTVALLAIEPDANKKILKGTAETKDSDAMITYIESLKQQKFFGEVVLTKHEINEQDPNHPLRFEFEAQWAEYPEHQEAEK